MVTDKSNRPVSGLKPSDFKLWDSGKPQKLSAFEVHSYVPPKQINPIALPPHQYTNFTTVSSTTQSSPALLNVVLFDLLNSPVLDRAVAHKELLKFLTKLPPVEGYRLRCISSGTGSGINRGSQSLDVLIAAAKQLLDNTAPVLDEDKVTQQRRGAGRLRRADGSRSR